MTLQQVLTDISAAAKARAPMHTSVQAAIAEVVKKNPAPFSLFEAQLDAEPKCGKWYDLNVNQKRDCDLLVGFRAITDTSFTVVAGEPQHHIRIPMTIAAGEVQLAWNNEAPFPIIRLVYHDFWIENLKGEVRRIGACLPNDLRRELAQRCTMPLGSRWITSHGMVGEGTVDTPCSLCKV